MINDIFKRMNVTSRSPKKGFLHEILNESFIGNGVSNNRLFPVQEVSKDDIKKIIDYVGVKGVPLSKLASFLGMHYLQAHDVAEVLSTMGILQFRTPEYVGVRKGVTKWESFFNKELLVLDSDNPNQSNRKKCQVHYVFEDSGIHISKVLDEDKEDVTDRVFIPRSVKEEFVTKSKTAYERMKAVRRVNMF